MPQKIGTALKLAAHGEWGVFRRQFNRLWRTRRLRAAGAVPFTHRTTGHPMVCFPDLPDSTAHYVEGGEGGEDPWEMELVLRWLQPGDAFVDAGANLGVYSHAVASHFRDEVSVLALEASSHLVKRLVLAAGLLREKNLQAVQVAVGAETGEVAFHLARPGLTTVSQSMRIDDAESPDYETHLLPMRPLAGLAADHLPGARVAAVKIDVEGAEPLALRGAPPAWLGADGPLWLVEINRPVLARMDFQPGDVLRHFPAAAFERWLLPKYPFGENQPIQARLFAEDENYTDARFYNLVAVPRGSPASAARARVGRLLPTTP